MAQYFLRLRLTMALFIGMSFLLMMSLSGWNAWVVPILLFVLVAAAAFTSFAWRRTRVATASPTVPVSAVVAPRELETRSSLVATHLELWRVREQVLEKARQILGATSIRNEPAT